MRLLLITILLTLSSCFADPKWFNNNLIENNDESSCFLESKNLNTCLFIKWVSRPTEDDYGSFEIKAYLGPDYSLEIPVSLSKINVILWMPSMNHGSSPVSIIEYSSSHYLVEDVFFIMPGDWDIRFNIGIPNGEEDEIIYKIHL